MKKFKVSGMSCAACSSRVEKAVSSLEGVSSCYVNLLTGDMGVEGTADAETVISAVEAAGYGASLYDKKERKDKKSIPEENGTSALRRRFLISLAFLVPLMYLSMGHVMWDFPVPIFLEENPVAIGLTQLILAAIVGVINQKFFINGFKGLFHGAPNMDTLVSIGAGASFVYSTWVLYSMTSKPEAVHGLHEMYFEGAAMILTLITLGKTLESYSKGKTTDAIRSLMALAPDSANVIRDGKEIKIPAEEMVKGDVFVVYSGEKISADGIVLEGACAVDESALTGESLPVDKKEGDKVNAATINKSGFIKCVATQTGEDTSLSEIIRMVSDASSEKAPVAKAADKVSGIFVPLVMTLALITTAVWLIIGEGVGFALARGISVLVISCPCALGLATPVAIMVGSGIGAKNGILFKSAVSLEETGKVKTVVLDKTGTLTKGEPVVTDLIPLGCTSEKLLCAAASLEAKSEHPLAKAIVSFAKENNVSKAECTSFEAIAGKGVSGQYDGQAIYGGSLDYISSVTDITKEQKEKAESLSLEGKTPMLFANEKGLFGIIAVADTLKSDSKAAIEKLHNLKIEVIMLTGDNEITAAAIGKAAGIDRIIAGVLPSGKEQVIRELKKNGKVMMVGDGINDAPALTSADIGVAIGAGTDVAIDAADVVLMKSSVFDVPKAIKLSRRTLKTIYENLFWAFFYNAAGIPIAAGVLIKAFGIGLSPMIAAAAMSLSSFFVVSNALRLNLYKKEIKKDASVSEDAKEYAKAIYEKEITTMTKTMIIEGMMCPHCEARVKKYLEELEGVSEAVTSHTDGTAIVTLTADVSDSILKDTVEKQGYTVVEIK